MGGSESRIAIEKAVSDFNTSRVDAQNTELWKLLFTTQISFEDVCVCLPPNSIRYMRLVQPWNLALLLHKCIERLHVMVHARQQQQQLNAIYFLTRILPTVFEVSVGHGNLKIDDAAQQYHAMDFASEFFWRNRAFAPDDAEKTFSSLADLTLTDRTLGQLLVWNVMQLAFLPAFTVPGDAKPDASAPLGSSVSCGLLWAPGAFSVAPQLRTNYYDANRLAVTRLLFTMCSRGLFADPSMTEAPSSLFLNAVVHPSTPHACTLVASLLNIVISHNPRGSVPYSSYLGLEHEALVEGALSLLLLIAVPNADALGPLLKKKPTDQHAAAEHSEKAAEGGAELKPKHSHPSIVWAVFDSLAKHQQGGIADAVRVADGLADLCLNPAESASSWLPGSQHVVNFTVQCVNLLWALLVGTPSFGPTVAAGSSCLRVVHALVYPLFAYADVPSSVGLIQVALTVLFSLSAEPAFSMALNQPLESHPRGLPSAVSPLVGSGTWGDVLVLALLHVLLPVRVHLVPSQVSVRHILRNIAPFAKRVSPAVAAKMLNTTERLLKRQARLCAAAASILKVDPVPSQPGIDFDGTEAVQSSVWESIVAAEQLVQIFLPYMAIICTQQFDSNPSFVYSILPLRLVVHAYVNAVTHVRNQLQSIDVAQCPDPQLGKVCQGLSVESFTPLVRVLDFVTPRVVAHRDANPTAAAADYVNVIASCTLVGTDVVDPSIVRRFEYIPDVRGSDVLAAMRATYAWYLALIVLQLDPPLYDQRAITLFSVHVPSQNATPTVANGPVIADTQGRSGAAGALDAVVDGMIAFVDRWVPPSLDPNMQDVVQGESATAQQSGSPVGQASPTSQPSPAPVAGPIPSSAAARSEAQPVVVAPPAAVTLPPPQAAPAAPASPAAAQPPAPSSVPAAPPAATVSVPRAVQVTAAPPQPAVKKGWLW